jgi:hypothetical protein
MNIDKFVQIPQVVWTGRKRPWELVTPCVYYSTLLGEEIVVPAGYATDLASVPRIPFVYSRYGNTAVVPAIIHDWLYENTDHTYSRKQADQVFLEAMSLIKDPPRATQRQMMYLGVRIGGWRAWRNYRNG